MYSSQIYCVIKRPFFARAAYHHILPSLLDMYNISLTHISCRSQWPFIKYLWMVVFLKRGAVYDHFGPSRAQPQWHQPKKFLFPYPPRFLVRTLRRHPPDISAQQPQPPMLCSNWICFSVHSGDESLSIWSGNEIFFTYITRVTRIYGSQQKKLVIVKCSVRTIR